jgi:diguanylate cyclase (GGDEF)-like protein
MHKPEKIFAFGNLSLTFPRHAARQHHQGATRMTDTDIQERSVGFFPAAAERLRGALLDSRQRWRDLVGLAADLAFEADHLGRLTFLHPDPALGWPSGIMVGGDASALLADGGDGTGFDPFRVTVRVRHRRAWLRRGDGGVVCLAFSAEPMLDSLGRIAGARGVGVDVTMFDAAGAQLAGALRLGDALDHILSRMGREVLAPKMLHAALEALASALGAEGSAALLLPSSDGPASIAHQTGAGADCILPTAAALLARHAGAPLQGKLGDGGPILVDICQARFGQQTGLAAWRAAGARPWDADDIRLIAAAGKIVRMALEHEAIQREMMRQARTDPLTGLMNRRAFREEVLRHTDRADRDGVPSTLMFVDLDHFKAVNDRLGHEVGDQVLVRTAAVLRDIVRPADLVARLGGDEFALWMAGADHMTAAERAEALRTAVPTALDEITGGVPPRVTLSIGIATRAVRADEDIDGLIRRADEAMYDAKRNGRGHWRVSLLEAG